MNSKKKNNRIYEGDKLKVYIQYITSTSTYIDFIINVLSFGINLQKLSPFCFYGGASHSNTKYSSRFVFSEL